MIQINNQQIIFRYELYEKAYSLAIDLNDRDLFMDLYWTTKSGIGTRAMATMALEKANQIISSESDESHSSQSSNCDCTECHSSSPSSSLRPPLPNVAITSSSPLYVPPIPSKRSSNNVTTISVPVCILHNNMKQVNFNNYLVLFNVFMYLFCFQYTSVNVENVHKKKIELPTTSLESVPHIKYPFEQQLLTQNIHSGVF